MKNSKLYSSKSEEEICTLITAATVPPVNNVSAQKPSKHFAPLKTSTAATDNILGGGGICMKHISSPDPINRFEEGDCFWGGIGVVDVSFGCPQRRVSRDVRWFAGCRR